MNFNDTSAANELKKIIVALGGADSIYDIPGQKSDDVIRDLAKAVENAIANGTLGGGGSSGPEPEWGESTTIVDNQKVKVIALGTEDDQSISFLKKVAENTMATLPQSQAEVIIAAGLLATIGQKSVTYNFQDPSKMVMLSEELIEQTGVEGYIISNTSGIRLYLSIELNDQGELTNLRLSLVDAEALQDVDTPVTVTTVPTLIGVSGMWSYSYRIPTTDEEEAYSLSPDTTAIIKFQPLKFGNRELSLIALARKTSTGVGTPIVYYTLTPFYGSDIIGISDNLRAHFIRAFRSLQTLKTLEFGAYSTPILKKFDDHCIYTLSL